jgi:NADPH:quinone reductase
VWLREFGAPSVLVAGDAPDPVPGPGQVLIDVAYANITFVETQFRATGFGPVTARPPLIPGNGVGGVIAAVGPETDAGLAGRRVVTSLNGTGGYASRVVVDAAAPVPVPDGLPLDEAVALLADGRTATEAAAGRLRPLIGQRFPLDRAADAHAAIESRATVGKTLLELSTPPIS